MRQKKSLDLNSKISLEALINEDIIKVYFKVGKKEYSVANEEVKELRDWLTKEVLFDVQNVPLQGTNVTQDVKDYLNIKGPTVSGPILANKDTIKLAEGNLEDRQAVITSGGVSDLNKTQGIITAKDELKMFNLSGQIGKAQEAFKPENLNKASS